MRQDWRYADDCAYALSKALTGRRYIQCCNERGAFQRPRFRPYTSACSACGLKSSGRLCRHTCGSRWRGPDAYGLSNAATSGISSCSMRVPRRYATRRFSLSALSSSPLRCPNRLCCMRPHGRFRTPSCAELPPPLSSQALRRSVRCIRSNRMEL